MIERDVYLLVGEAEPLAQLGLVLGAQVGVPLEGLLQAVDLVRCEGGAGPPATGRGQGKGRMRRWRRGVEALGGGTGGERLASFTLIARCLFFFF